MLWLTDSLEGEQMQLYNIEVASSNPVPATFAKSLPNCHLYYPPAVGSAARLTREKPVDYRIQEKRGRRDAKSRQPRSHLIVTTSQQDANLLIKHKLLICGGIALRFLP